MLLVTLVMIMPWLITVTRKPPPPNTASPPWWEGKLRKRLTQKMGVFLYCSKETACSVVQRETARSVLPMETAHYVRQRETAVQGETVRDVV